MRESSITGYRAVGGNDDASPYNTRGTESRLLDGGDKVSPPKCSGGDTGERSVGKNPRGKGGYA